MKAAAEEVVKWPTNEAHCAKLLLRRWPHTHICCEFKPYSE